MNHDELERRLRTAAEHAAPDVLDRVLSSCGEQKGTVIPMKPPKKKRFIPAFAAAAVLVLVCAAVLYLSPWQRADASAVIILDVNPSLSLSVDGNERVVEAIPLNDDGRVVLEDMDLEDTDLNVAVNAIIGSMLQHGYLDIDNFENAILVSVESGDADRAAQLQQQVSDTISGVFQADDPLILTQTVAADGSLSALAEQYGISQGKAALIQEITAQDSTLTFQTLAPLTINEIALIANSRGLSSSSVTQTGSASEAAYIGAKAALELACTSVGVPVNSALDAEVEFDCEDGMMIYEVEFCYDGVEYDFNLDAHTGDILRSRHETCTHSYHSGSHHDESYTQPSAPVSPSANMDGPSAPAAPSANVSAPAPATPSPLPTAPAAPSPLPTAPVAPAASPVPAASPAAYIGEAAAQSAALSHAGVSAGNTEYLKCWLEYDGGRPKYYEVEFCCDGLEYEYEIGLYDGSVLEYSRETCTNSSHSHSAETGQTHHGSGHHSGQTTAPTQTLIGQDAARDTALTHAGVSLSSAFKLEVELDKKDSVYEVEFKANGYEYEYEINAYTGEVMKYKKEVDD